MTALARLVETVAASARQIAEHKRSFLIRLVLFAFILALLPTAAHWLSFLVAKQQAWELFMPLQLTAYLLPLVLCMGLSLSWLRLCLKPPADISGIARTLLFFAAFVALMLLLYVLVLATGMAFDVLLAVTGSTALFSLLYANPFAWVFLYLPLLWLPVRFLPMLPAIAAGTPASPIHAWRSARGFLLALHASTLIALVGGFLLPMTLRKWLIPPNHIFLGVRPGETTPLPPVEPHWILQIAPQAYDTFAALIAVAATLFFAGMLAEIHRRIVGCTANEET